MRAKLAELRSRVELDIGRAVRLMMNLPRYKNPTLGDLEHLLIEPLVHDGLAFGSARTKNAPEGKGGTAGLSIWASVSDEVDAKLREQVKGGAILARLAADDWTSGDKLWLLDVITPNRRFATAVLANFRQVAGDRPSRFT